MRPSTIWYTLKQGVKNIKRNWMFSLASIITMAACIFLFGIFFSIVNNVNNIAHKVEQEVPITVFFEEGTTNKQIKAIGKKIKARPEVEKIEYQSADEAWEEYKEQYFQGSEAADGFKDDNPLANSANYRVYMNDITKQSELVSYIQELKHVGSSKNTGKYQQACFLYFHCHHCITAYYLHIPDQQYGICGYCSP